MARRRIYRRTGVLFLVVLLLISGPSEVLWFHMPDTSPVIVQGVTRLRRRRRRPGSAGRLVHGSARRAEIETD